MEELTMELLGNRETVRENTQRGEDIVKIPLDKISVRAGFNVRQDYGDIESLSESIIENGQTLPGRVDVLKDGTFVLTDGHRRFEALKLLESKGHECFFKAVVNTSKTTEEQRILQMFTTQDNKPLLPHEVAELIQKLINLGHSQKYIAKKIGKTTGYVSQMLAYSRESVSVKQHVEAGNITVNDVVKLQKTVKSGKERAARVEEIVKSGQKASKVIRNSEKERQAKKIAKAIIADDKTQTEERLIEIITPLL